MANPPMVIERRPAPAPARTPNIGRAASEMLAKQDWLDPIGKTLQEGVERLFEAAGPTGQHVKNFLHGVWLGHPLHPVLTDVPIGAWSMALVLDGLEVSTGRRSYGTGADALVGVGLAGALSAAVTGLTDWQHVGGRPRRVGMVHALSNIIATGLYAGSWLMRRRRNRRAGRGLGLAGFLVSMIGAYLGGHLVYAQRIGVKQIEEDAGPEQFTPVLPLAELTEGRLHRAGPNGTPILLVRRGDRIYALAEKCAHLGGPLSEGWLVGDSVVCPWHKSRYGLEDGHVIDGPSTHDQPCFETRVRNGFVEVRSAARAQERS